MKGYIYGGIAILVLILTGTAYFLYKQNIKEAGTAAVATSINAGNTVVQEKKDDADKITSKVNEDNTVKKEENDNATTQVIVNANQKKKEAQKVYEAGPKTPEAAATLDKAEDQADIDSLWDAFCKGKPNHPQCTNVGATK